MPSPHEGRARRRPGIPARRRWGQNFLASGETAERIVAAARVGPGDGALTRPLADRVACVAAVEIDPLRARALAAELSGRPNVRVLEGDALARPFRDWLDAAGCAAPAVLVANLPYNVATPILTTAIESPGAIRRSVATVQREVARRFVARPGDEG